MLYVFADEGIERTWVARNYAGPLSTLRYRVDDDPLKVTWERKRYMLMPEPAKTWYRHLIEFSGGKYSLPAEKWRLIY